MKKLLLLFMAAIMISLTSVAQQRTVRGVVFGAYNGGEPLVGATVMGVGTKIGTVTNVDGVFSITLPESVNKLLVTYVGMRPQEFDIVPGENAITLESDNSLDEVVVTALGISRNEKSLGYAVTSVTGDEISSARTTTAMEALQGKVAGLQIQTVSSDPGSAANVNIRGLGSINGSNQPLYVVDGVPVQSGSFISDGHQIATGGVNNISPDDIASLTVLKGAAATALYGSRASNGVIIITTKTGSASESKNYSVTYSGGVSARRVGILPELQNKWGQGWNGDQTYIENGSWGPIMDGSTLVYGPVYDHQQLIHNYSARKNNVRDFFDTGWSQNHNVALSGQSSDNKMNYYASYSYTGDNGIMPGDYDTYKRNTIAVRGSYQPEKYFKLSTSMNFATWTTKTVGNYQGTSVIDALLQTPRDISIVDMKDFESSPFYRPEAYFTPYGATNPYWAIANNYNTLQGKQVFGKVQLDVMPINGLTLSYRFGFDYSDYDTKIGFPQITLDDALVDDDYGYPPSSMNQDGNVYTSYIREHEINHDFLAVYNNKYLDNRLDLSATVGVNINERASTSMYGQTDQLSINTGFWQLGNGSTKTTLAESQNKRRLVGLFGDISLGWDEFLFLDVTARNDWSSTLPIKANSFFYPGVTLSGVFTHFMDNKDILSFGKGVWLMARQVTMLRFTRLPLSISKPIQTEFMVMTSSSSRLIPATRLWHPLWPEARTCALR